MKSFLVAGTLASIAIVSIVSLQRTDAEDTKLAPNNRDFHGKIVTVYFDGQTLSQGACVTDVELKQIGGKMILVGTYADTHRPGDMAGSSVGIAWDRVAMYYVMTPEKFEAHLKAAQR